MPEFSLLLPDDVKTALEQNFDKIKTYRTENYNLQSELVQCYNFCLVDK